MTPYGVAAYDSQGDCMSWFAWDTPDLVLGSGIIITESPFVLRKCPVWKTY